MFVFTSFHKSRFKLHQVEPSLRPLHGTAHDSRTAVGLHKRAANWPAQKVKPLKDHRLLYSFFYQKYPKQMLLFPDHFFLNFEMFPLKLALKPQAKRLLSALAPKQPQGQPNRMAINSLPLRPSENLPEVFFQSKGFILDGL